MPGAQLVAMSSFSLRVEAKDRVVQGAPWAPVVLVRVDEGTQIDHILGKIYDCHPTLANLAFNRVATFWNCVQTSNRIGRQAIRPTWLSSGGNR